MLETKLFTKSKFEVYRIFLSRRNQFLNVFEDRIMEIGHIEKNREPASKRLSYQELKQAGDNGGVWPHRQGLAFRS